MIPVNYQADSSSLRGDVWMPNFGRKLHCWRCERISTEKSECDGQL